MKTVTPTAPSSAPQQEVTTGEKVMRPRRSPLWWLLVLGPGIIVMLADTDAGSVITAAQSGAEWGYQLLLPQFLLIPILYSIQEITVRLGVLTGQGHGALIRDRFGRGWAVLSVGTLFASCVGALITEFVGIAGVGELFGLPRWTTVGAAALFLLALAVSGSYTRVERVGIAVGLLEVLFIPAALLAHPQLDAVAHGLVSIPLNQRGYVFLLAANVGAVIMPWMVFYQQGAVIDKGLRRQQLRLSRWDTLVGAVATQLIMAAVIVVTAATIGRTHPNTPLDSVGAIARALAPFLGWDSARILFGLGIVGAAFVAALVVSLAAAWGISEVFGCRHSLNDPIPRAPLLLAVRGGHHRRRRPGDRGGQPRQHRGRCRGDERHAAAHRARLPARARSDGVARGAAHARPLALHGLDPGRRRDATGHLYRRRHAAARREWLVASD